MPTSWTFTRRRLVWIGLGLGVSLLLVLAMRPAPLPVETARAARGPLRITLDEEGEVRAHDRYVVAAPVAGRLSRIALREGDTVRQGEVVARVLPLPLAEREREELEARVAAALASQRAAEERLQRARTDLAQAQRERTRLDKLAKQGHVSTQGAEQARTHETALNNEAAAASFQMESARAQTRAAQAALRVIAAGAPVEVRAPVAGQVLRMAEQSERVVAAGAPLLTIGDPSRYEIVLDLLTTEAVKVRPGMPMRLENWGGDQALRARVRLVEPSAFTKVSALGVEEQRVNVIADFVDPPGPLGDGYRVEGHIVIFEGADVLKVPATSLFRHGAGWGVFVVERGRSVPRAVDVGRRNDQEAEIITGLDEGTVVIRHPSNALENGGRVIEQ
jgi:HlyD family secretion protein